MAVFSVIKKSELEGAQRIDAEYYKPDFLGVGKILKGSKTIGDVARTFDLQSNGAFKQIFNILNDGQEKIIPYIRSENAGDFFIDTSNLAYISEKAHSKLPKTKTQLEDIVMARKGRIGGATLITKEAVGFNSNDNIVNIKIKDKKKLDPYYFITFFNSQIGLKQIERVATGNVQPWLSMFQLRNLQIPIPNIAFQQKVKSIVMLAHQEVNSMRKLYTDAEKVLLEELDIKASDFVDELSYVVDFAEARERADAEYFQPKYKKLVEKLNQYGAKRLTELAYNVKADFSPAVQADKLFNYVELSNINSSIGLIDGSSEVLGGEAPSRAKRILKPNDVVVSSVEGSLEKVALVEAAQADYLASTGFFQFRSNKILPEALLVLAKSLVLQLQLKQHCAGTILTAVPKDSLNQMILPDLPKETQEKIGELVRQSHEARRKSKELLEQAKRQVEELIEKQ